MESGSKLRGGGVLHPSHQWPPFPGSVYYDDWRKGTRDRPPSHFMLDMPNEMLVERLRKLMIRHTKVAHDGSQPRRA
jgi:hypothetical protein